MTSTKRGHPTRHPVRGRVGWATFRGETRSTLKGITSGYSLFFLDGNDNNQTDEGDMGVRDKGKEGEGERE